MWEVLKADAQVQVSILLTEDHIADLSREIRELRSNQMENHFSMIQVAQEQKNLNSINQ